MSASPSSKDFEPRDAVVVGAWARLVFSTLRDAGVRDVYVSPGSRSTPFTWAAAHTEGLNVRVIVDERSAAFVALGQTKVTGRPSALLCTSGSAAANYFPAVVEASLSHLPLLLLTADRPLEAQASGAAQTIDQIKLYGDFARACFDLGLPDTNQTALVHARRALSQAVASSLGPVPGPVQINLRVRKPLEPAAPHSASEQALALRVAAVSGQPLSRHAPETHVAPEALSAVLQALREARDGAIVVGPLQAFRPNLARSIAELSRLLGYPIFAEAASQVRFELASEPAALPLFDWLLSTPGAAERYRPELLLCIGRTPTSGGFERWAPSVPRRLVLAEHDFPDAIGGAELVASGDLAQALSALVSELRVAPPARSGPSWLGELQAAHQSCEGHLTEALKGSAELSEAAAVKSVLAGLPDGAVLSVGNSLPIRDVDAYVTSAARVMVLAQRGANGIDGLVSGAVGSALAGDAPTLLLLGDVSLLHDVGGLAAARLVSSPLVIAVIDNAGGRIFDQLPVRELYAPEPSAASLWLTPPPQKLEHIAAFFGLAYEAPSTPEAIRSSTALALTRRVPTLLHLRVAPDSARAMRAQVLEALASELRERG